MQLFRNRMSHYLRMGDLQTPAVLSCLFGKHQQQMPKQDKGQQKQQQQQQRSSRTSNTQMKPQVRKHFHKCEGSEKGKAQIRVFIWDFTSVLWSLWNLDWCLVFLVLIIFLVHERVYFWSQHVFFVNIVLIELFFLCVHR